MNTREPREPIEPIQTNPIQEEPSTESSSLSTDPSTASSTDPSTVETESSIDTATSTEPSTAHSTVETEPSIDTAPSTEPSTAHSTVETVETEPSIDTATSTASSKATTESSIDTAPSTAPSTDPSIPEELPPVTEMDIQQLRTKEKNIRSMILNKKPQCEIHPESTPLLYTEKIQIKNELTNAEERITEVLKEHPTLHPYLNFQLPIKTIPISISTIDKSSIKKCTEQDIRELFAIQPTNEPLIQTTYKKIGGSLFDYLRTSIEKPQYFLQVLIDSHLHLLNSISKLQSVSINHFHLTEENILYDEINAIPVISDFRMAFTKDELEGDQTNELFPVYDESLIWCIEIYVLSQLIENIAKQEIFTQEIMEVLLQQFISSYVFKNLFDENQLKEFYGRMKQFFGKYMNRLHTEVISDLKKYATSWDTFSLSMVYLLFINEIHGVSLPSTTPSFMEKYKTILINTILSDPDKRPSVSFLRESIENTFSNISQQELNEYFHNVLEINQSDDELSD